MKFLEKIIFNHMSRYLDRMAPGQLIGPLSFSRIEDASWIKKLTAFRTQIVKDKAPYLLDENQQKIENEFQLDERSYHFILVENGEILSAVRVTPYPFECQHFFPNLQNKKYKNHYEYSRLMALELPNSRRSFLAKWPMIKAALWLFSQTDCMGIICMARIDRVAFLKKFGMKKMNETSTYINDRDGHYHPFSASRMRLVLCHVANYLGIDLNFKRRNIYESKMVTK